MVTNFISHIHKKGFFMILSIVVFYAIFTLYSDYAKIIENFSRIQLWYMPVIILTGFLSIFLKSIRQQFLLKSVSIKLSFKKNLILFIASLSFLMTPAASGTFVKTYFLKKKLGISISRTIPVVLIERYFDVVGIFSIISLFLIFRYMEILLVPTLTIDLFLIFTVIVLKNEKILDKMINFIRLLPRLNRLSDFLLTYRSSVSLLLSKRNLVLITPFSMLCWMMDGLTAYLCFLSFGQSLDVFQSSLISLSSLVFGFITLIPGGLGVTEISMAGLLVKQGINISLASSMVLFIRIWTIWFATFLGMVFARPALKSEN